ncbi:exodeoxyribonuclease III [Solimonas flava]|uniref:exodeoxyribonuclease III n=1 Tax=Solimonas flava TaxID=415849 RepID=UPI0003FF04F3|nr:exodeoxyribonuclease III [Solimonas flava]
MKIATWNVNSLNVRLPHLLDWLKAQESSGPVDVVALQELKLVDEAFPHAALAEAGYRAVSNGQKTYNGVALLARSELQDVVRDMDGFGDEQKRVIAATIGGVRFVSVYVVNGQALGSEKYAYKLRFLEALHDYLAAELDRYPLLAVGGDYNIAPAPEDTHDPKTWEGEILCSEPERAGLRRLQALGLHDVYRLFPQAPGGFTWWDYRAGAFARNQGLRIDHWLLSSPLAARARGARIDLAPRRLERPSDHAPLLVELGPQA